MDGGQMNEFITGIVVLLVSIVMFAAGAFWNLNPQYSRSTWERWRAILPRLPEMSTAGDKTSRLFGYINLLISIGLTMVLVKYVMDYLSPK